MLRKRVGWGMIELDFSLDKFYNTMAVLDVVTTHCVIGMMERTYRAHWLREACKWKYDESLKSTEISQLWA